MKESDLKRVSTKWGPLSWGLAKTIDAIKKQQRKLKKQTWRSGACSQPGRDWGPGKGAQDLGGIPKREKKEGKFYQVAEKSTTTRLNRRPKEFTGQRKKIQEWGGKK